MKDGIEVDLVTFVAPAHGKVELKGLVGGQQYVVLKVEDFAKLTVRAAPPPHGTLTVDGMPEEEWAKRTQIGATTNREEEG